MVTEPASPFSSLVQTRRECGVTSTYRAEERHGLRRRGMLDLAGGSCRRCGHPSRTTRRVMPIDFGIHHCLKSSAFVQASNTRRAGASTVLVTTTSRSETRSTVVEGFTRVGSLSLWTASTFSFRFISSTTSVERIEARGPELAIALDPGDLFIQSPRSQPAGAHPPQLPRGDEPRLLQDAHVLLHARQGHPEPAGEVRDGRISPPELLQDAAAGDVRQRGKRGFEGRSDYTEPYGSVCGAPRPFAIGSWAWRHWVKSRLTGDRGGNKSNRAQPAGRALQWGNLCPINDSYTYGSRTAVGLRSTANTGGPG